MKQWQREDEALTRLGFADTRTPERQRAVDLVIELLREIERLKQKGGG